jgi:hypothetical protein
MEPGKGAGGEANQEAGARSRFRLSFTVAVLQLTVAVVGVGVALFVARQRDGTPSDVRRTTDTGSQIANAAAPGSGTGSVRRISTPRASSNPRTVAKPSARPAPVDPGGSTTSSNVYGAAWPAGVVGYTVALASDIIRADAVGAVAKARTAGLSHVGVLRSDHYASLRPGYLFVFSGVYATAQEARRWVPTAVDAGFSDAYVRRVAE